MQLRPTPINTTHHGLTYSDEINALVCEDSTLPEPSRVYDDACDVGYTVVDGKTGREFVVALAREKRSTSSGELLCWEYDPIPGSPRYALLLRVYND